MADPHDVMFWNQMPFVVQGPDGRPTVVPATGQAGLGMAGRQGPMGPWTPGTPYTTPQAASATTEEPSWLERAWENLKAGLERGAGDRSAAREPAPYTGIGPALARGLENLQRGLDPRAYSEQTVSQGSPRTAMDSPRERMPGVLPAGLGGPRAFQGKSTVPTPVSQPGRGLAQMSKAPSSGRVVKASTGQPQPVPAAATTSAFLGKTDAPAAPQAPTLASYIQSLQSALGGTRPSAEDREQRRQQALGNALMTAGFGAMASGAQPGAGLFSALGSGGLAGMGAYQGYMDRENAAQRQAMQDRLGLFKTAADLYGADQTRAATETWRQDQSRRADERLAEDRRYRDARLAEDRRHHDLVNARANMPTPRDPEAIKNDRVRTQLAVEKAAREASEDPMTGEVDPVRYQQEYIGTLQRLGLVNYPESQSDVDALKSGDIFYNPGTGQYEVKR